MHAKVEIISRSFDKELRNILSFWEQYSVDDIYGGFVGQRDHFNKLVPNATKGIILNSRILWSFSAACNHFQSNEYFELSKRSFEYLNENFRDHRHRGVYWELDQMGNVINDKKQIYAQAFMIYALSEYYKYSRDKEALGWAIELYDLIEINASDKDYGGYIEAYNRNWTPVVDMRLSLKDENVAKTMNTHLHILEAYTNLLRVHDSVELKSKLNKLVRLFLEKFINSEHRTNLFFGEKWNKKGNLISFGHDIETAWLLVDAAEVCGDSELIDKAKIKAVLIADTFMKNGVDNDGGVFYEFDPTSGILDGDKHWWPQAEAIIGLRLAFEITGNEKYLDCSLIILNFIENKIIDRENGEWFWKTDKEGKASIDQYKIGFWKAPYHNARACMKLI